MDEDREILKNVNKLGHVIREEYTLKTGIEGNEEPCKRNERE